MIQTKTQWGHPQISLWPPCVNFVRDAPAPSEPFYLRQMFLRSCPQGSRRARAVRPASAHRRTAALHHADLLPDTGTRLGPELKRICARHGGEKEFGRLLSVRRTRQRRKSAEFGCDVTSKKKKNPWRGDKVSCHVTPVNKIQNTSLKTFKKFFTQLKTK